MVQKVLRYELNPAAGEWRSRLAFVADDAYGPDGARDSCR